QGVHGMQERRRRAGRRERRGDLASDQPGLTDARHEEAPPRGREQPHGPGERGPQPLSDPPDRRRFEGQPPAPALNEIGGLGTRHRHARRNTVTANPATRPGPGGSAPPPRAPRPGRPGRRSPRAPPPSPRGPRSRPRWGAPRAPGAASP